MSGSILLLEDDSSIVEVVERELRSIGFPAITFGTGEDALQQFVPGKFVLAILDLTLPGIGGLEVCRALRAKDQKVPILILTSRTSEADKVLGFELGADDYLAKPFGIAEFRARVQALLRRGKLLETTSSANFAVLAFDGLNVDLEHRKVLLRGEPLELTPIEFEMLVLLASNPQKPITKQQLLELIWGYDSMVYEQNLAPHISRLRKKLELDPMNPQFIKTIWGVGYSFIGQRITE